MLEKLRAALAKLQAKVDLILEGAMGEDGTGKLTDEQRADVDGLNTEIETCEADIERVEKSEASKAKAAAVAAVIPAQAKTLEVVEGKGDGKAKAIADTGGGIQVSVDGEHEANRGFQYNRDFLMAVMNHAQGANMDERLNAIHIEGAVGSDEHGGHSDPRGGFLVPEAFSPQLLMVPNEDDPVAGRTTMIPMGSDIVKIAARVDKDHTSSVSGGLTVTRKPQTVAGTSSRLLLEQLELKASTLFGLSFATEELMMDSPISFAAILEAGFQDEFRANHIDETLNGTGVGEFLGVNNSPGTVVQAKEGSQSDFTINFENVINMRSRVWGYGNAIWMANHDTIPQLSAISDGDGRRLFMPSIVTDIPDTFLGKPIFFSEFLEKLGDQGDIMAANFTQYLEGVRQPMQSAESIHVRFVEHERAFKFWLRNAGMPWWSAPLTPKKSSVTLSPFVVLADRKP